MSLAEEHWFGCVFQHWKRVSHQSGTRCFFFSFFFFSNQQSQYTVRIAIYTKWRQQKQAKKQTKQNAAVCCTMT